MLARRLQFAVVVSAALLLLAVLVVVFSLLSDRFLTVRNFQNILVVQTVVACMGLAALLPLTRSALRGVEARGLAAGYTGPIARGDAQVVAAHLAALPPEVAAVYRPLSRRGLTLVEHRLPAEAVADLNARLE